jgi:hypothetical protein
MEARVLLRGLPFLLSTVGFEAGLSLNQELQLDRLMNMLVSHSFSVLGLKICFFGWGEERVYSSYTSILLFITKEVRTGTQAGQEAGADAEAMEGCSLLACLLPLACSSCSLIEPKTTSPEMVPPTRGLSPLITN